MDIISSQEEGIAADIGDIVVDSVSRSLPDIAEAIPDQIVIKS